MKSTLQELPSFCSKSCSTFGDKENYTKSSTYRDRKRGGSPGMRVPLKKYEESGEEVIPIELRMDLIRQYQ